ncbi:hypothetical protein THASP1DRAFT_11039, partial [Thamnocephalis sphaerospora]
MRHQGDLNTLMNCATVRGSVVISQYTGDVAALIGIRAIDGNLVVESNFNMKQLLLPDVQQITGELSLRNNTQIKEVDTGRLRSVSRFIAEVNPSLVKVGFPSGLRYVDYLRVTDSMLKGIDGLNMEQAGEIEFSANRYLTAVKLDHLQSMNGRLLITDNAPDSSFSARRLGSIAGNVTMTQLATIALPSLTTLGTGLHLHQGSMRELVMDNLTSLAETLSIYANPELESLSFQSLETIGGALLITDNPKLQQVTAFPNLKSVSGSVEVTGGPLQEIQLNNLQDVAGAVKIITSSKAACREGELIGFSKKVVKGKFECK